MVNFRCQLEWSKGYLDSWQNIISEMLFLETINVRISGLSEENLPSLNVSAHHPISWGPDKTKGQRKANSLFLSLSFFSLFLLSLSLSLSLRTRLFSCHWSFKLQVLWPLYSTACISSPWVLMSLDWELHHQFPWFWVLWTWIEPQYWLPGPLACRWPVMGLLRLYNHEKSSP